MSDETGTAQKGPAPEGDVVSLSEIDASNYERIPCGVDGIDHILGRDRATETYGIAARAGQIVGLCGEPGAGKSSALLSVCQGYARQHARVLYVATEETLEQIKERCARVGKFSEKYFLLLRESELEPLLGKIEEVRPDILVIDSINQVYVEDYAPGSATAVRIVTRETKKFVDEQGIGAWIVMQMSKDGDLAGPKELEHNVSTMLMMRLLADGVRRRLECKTKNRFGSTPMHQDFVMNTDGRLEEYEEPEVEEIAAP